MGRAERPVQYYHSGRSFPRLIVHAAGIALFEEVAVEEEGVARDPAIRSGERFARVSRDLRDNGS